MEEKTGWDSAVFQNLVDAGCETGLIERFFQLRQLGKEPEQAVLLSNYRRLLLDNLHDTQKRLDCLDYLLYQMRKNNKE